MLTLFTTGMIAFQALTGKGVRSKGSGTFHEGWNALKRSSETSAKAGRSNGTIWNDELERSAQTATFQCFPFLRTGTGTRWVVREMERPNRLAAEAAIPSVGMRKGVCRGWSAAREERRLIILPNAKPSGSPGRTIERKEPAHGNAQRIAPPRQQGRPLACGQDQPSSAV